MDSLHAELVPEYLYIAIDVTRIGVITEIVEAAGDDAAFMTGVWR